MYTRTVPDTLFDFAWPERDIACRVVGGRSHYDVVVSQLEQAQRSLWIATANLKDMMVEAGRGRGRRTRYRSILETFAQLHHRGVEIRLLHAGHPSRAFREQFDALDALVSGGLQLRQCPRVHLKLVIVDAQWLYLGSANWTGAGLGVKSADRRNFELGIVSRDLDLLDQTQAMYAALWDGHPCGTCRLRDACEAPLDCT